MKQLLNKQNIAKPKPLKMKICRRRKAFYCNFYFLGFGRKPLCILLFLSRTRAKSILRFANQSLLLNGKISFPFQKFVQLNQITASVPWNCTKSTIAPKFFLIFWFLIYSVPNKYKFGQKSLRVWHTKWAFYDDKTTLWCWDQTKYLRPLKRVKKPAFFGAKCKHEKVGLFFQLPFWWVVKNDEILPIFQRLSLEKMTKRL